MAKSRKKRRRKQHAPKLSPLALLRPRLDGLLGNEALARKDSQALKADMNAVFKGVEASEFLPVLLKAFPHAPAPVQARLDVVVPEWLDECKYLDTLLELLNQRRVGSEDRQRALTWLEAAGVDLSGLQERQAQAPFYQAYMYVDDFQGFIIVFWYADSRRRRVRSMSFLIDLHPPWEGAIKDIAVFPQRPLERAIQEYVDFWKQGGMSPTPLGAAEAKREILKSLEANRREEIRLPRDLIRARDLFLEYVLSLPDTPETPPFTAEDFDQLARTGESPESITHLEQTVGRRVRLEDGTEVIVTGDPFDEDEW